MFDAKPEDRDEIALWIMDIETDHKPGPDGVLVAVDKVTFGKKGTNNWSMNYTIPRLMKENPNVWEWFKPAYEKWKATNEIVHTGHDLMAWPAITKGQIKACRDLGLHTVEDIATATSSIREKLGIGAMELMTKAKAFVENKDASAAANRIAELEKIVTQQGKDLDEARATVDKFMAAKGQKPTKPAKTKPLAEAA